MEGLPTEKKCQLHGLLTGWTGYRVPGTIERGDQRGYQPGDHWSPHRGAAPGDRTR